MTMDEFLMTKGFGWLFSLLVYASSMYLAYNVGHSKAFIKCGCCGYKGSEVSRYLRDEVRLFRTAVLLWNIHVLEKHFTSDEEVDDGKD